MFRCIEIRSDDGESCHNPKGAGLSYSQEIRVDGKADIKNNSCEPSEPHQGEEANVVVQGTRIDNVVVGCEGREVCHEEQIVEELN